MRSAERIAAWTGAAACLCLCSCAWLSPSPKAVEDAAPVAAPAAGAANSKAVATPAAATPAAATPSAATSGASASAIPPGPAIPDLGPAVVHSFDAAVRALQEGHAEEAERGFRALVQSHPELGGPHANLGVLYLHEGKFDDAVAELELAVRCNEHQPVYWNQLGIALRRQGSFAKARAAYERSISLDPAYATPNLNLGILFDLFLWDSKAALEHYDRYLALSPGGDATVAKWVADLKNRDRALTALTRKEQE